MENEFARVKECLDVITTYLYEASCSIHNAHKDCLDSITLREREILYGLKHILVDVECLRDNL